MTALRSIGLLFLMAALLAAIGTAGLWGMGGMPGEHLVVVLSEGCFPSPGLLKRPNTRMNAGRDACAPRIFGSDIQLGNRHNICMAQLGLAQPACEVIRIIEEVPARDGYDTNCRDA